MAKKNEKNVKDIDPQQVRLDLFNKQLEDLQTKSGFKLYAANQVFDNGEVIPMIKIQDLLAVKRVQQNEDTTKARDIANKKA